MSFVVIGKLRNPFRLDDVTVSDLVLEGDESTVGQAVRDIPCLMISVEAQ